ncbi:MAG: Hydroxyacylglutathione hydrolase [Turneriella sp.]|nr:Hydroxyacylglutathione hydrolase [Turneriella sp.]
MKLFFICLSVATFGILGCHTKTQNISSVIEKIYAVKYGESLYPSRLLNTKNTIGKTSINWLAYLVVHSDNTKTLIDCGFSDAALLKKFGIKHFKPVTEILYSLGIKPQDITRIILTHTHFDHALDVDKYPNATIYVHSNEIKSPHVKSLKNIFDTIASQKRLVEITEEVNTVGFKIVPSQGHTEGSIVVTAKINNVFVVFTGDECYFAESCRAKIGLPRAAAFDVYENKRFIQSIPASTEILSGHETQLKNGKWINNHLFYLFF